MEPKLWATLRDAINEWIGQECESDEWRVLDVIIGDDTSKLMAQAAWSVLAACAESQKYGIAQGYFTES